MRVGRRVCVFFVTVCDVPSDPSECLKLHYIRFSILPPKPLCHSVSVCEEEDAIDFPHTSCINMRKHTHIHKNSYLYILKGLHLGTKHMHECMYTAHFYTYRYCMCTDDISVFWRC